jgi:hypothetical protein
MTSLIRLQVPSSMPFIRLTSTASPLISGRHSVRLTRRVWAGTARTRYAAPSIASVTSVVARSRSGSEQSGR